MPKLKPFARTAPWFLSEWMHALGLRQADLMQRTGWSKTTASLLYNGRQKYNPVLLMEAADAMNLRPFELFLPPDEAMAIRRMREAALQIVAATPERSTAQRRTV